jgi:RNase P subunit RPR2
VPKYFVEGEPICVKRVFELFDVDSPEEAVKQFNSKYCEYNYRANTVATEDDTNWGDVIGYCEACRTPLFLGTFGREYRLNAEDGIYLCCECCHDED